MAVTREGERRYGAAPDDVVDGSDEMLGKSCQASKLVNGSSVFCNRRAGHLGEHWTHWAVEPYYWRIERVR